MPAVGLGLRFGRVDALANNAGAIFDPWRGSTGSSSVFEADPENIRKSFDTNTIGPLLVIQAFVPTMRKAGTGTIVNVSTGMASLSDMNGNYPGYRLSKTALNALTRVVADELSDTAIRVNVVVRESGAGSTVFAPNHGHNGQIFGHERQEGSHNRPKALGPKTTENARHR